MKPKNLWLLTLIFFAPLFSYAQAIDNTAIFRATTDSNYFRFSYDNDFFTATDQYYTQGLNFEIVNSRFYKNPINKILFHYKDGNNKYGIALEHDGYTPSSIRHEEIILNDHPFVAAIMLKSFTASINKNNTKRLTSSLSLGIFGTSAFGEQMQKSIHKALNNIEPLGWQHQIHDDVIVNYELGIDHLITSGKYFSLNSNSQIRVGTFNDKIKTGLTFSFGKINTPFNLTSSEKELHLYIYNQSLLNIIGYDATLQGGLFNRSSPYTLNNNEISRLTFQDNYGIVLTYKKLYLEYLQSFTTREFKAGNYHRYGGIKMGFSF